MWQRFSEQARKAVFYAQEEAQRFGENYVGTEHLLLGLIHDPGNGASAILCALNIRCEDVRTVVESKLQRDDQGGPHNMTLTPRSKHVIDLAYREANQLNDRHIGTEHLLLGLIQEMGEWLDLPSLKLEWNWKLPEMQLGRLALKRVKRLPHSWESNPKRFGAS
jgi:ATP-dependent Clp protease ATP-binding subunit ClpC